MFDRSIMIQHHLQYNHVPSVHLVFTESAELAIDFVGQGDWDHPINLPNGRTMTARKVVEELHLECFLDPDAVEMEEDAY